MKKNKFLPLLLALTLLCGCGGQNMTIIDKDGKSIDVASAGKDTYTFSLPEKNTTPLPQWDNPFTDVTEGNWFYQSVRYCHENGLISGTTESNFSPDAPASRAMVVSILWRLEGAPETDSAIFVDIPADEYYADAVAWAASEKIVSGYDAEHFAPDAPVSREQLAAILYRYASYHNWDMMPGSLSDFADADTVSPYAEDAVAWAAAQGIINGMEDHLLTPQGEATRAQFASILMNLCENITH